MSSLENLISRMTLAELARLANTDVEGVVALAFGGASPRATTNGATARPAHTRDRSAKIQRGGLRIDHVLTALSGAGGPTTLSDVQSKVGGSAAQVRAALKKLAKAGKVRITGERRGTRYAAR